MTSVAPSSVADGQRPASLLTRLAHGRVTAAVTFAGQGADALMELSKLVAQRPALRDGLAVATAGLSDDVGSPAGQASGRYRHGIDLLAWAEDPEGAPPPAYLSSAGISYPLILVTQALVWRALWEDGLGDAVRAGAIVAAAGHSQGLLSALLVAEAGPRGIDDALLARYVRLAWRRARTPRRCAYAGSDAPMAVVSGVRHARLRADRRRAQRRAGGGRRRRDRARQHAAAMCRERAAGDARPAARAACRACARAEAGARREGRHGGAPLAFGWNALGVDVAFHTPALAAARDGLVVALRAEPRMLPDPAALSMAVLSPADASDLRAAPDLASAIATAQFVAPVRWDAVSRTLARTGAEWILDLGPGTDVSALTAENLRGLGTRTLALSSPEGRRRLTSPGASPQRPDATYASFAPGVVELPGGRRHLDGRYTRHTGRPPVILAGMTPTTADAPIVAAAANAGYMAELAGGGQPDRWTFERRIAELRELLEPGREVVFNTLLLDRHLWELHISREGLVVEARRAGAPLAGLTVSAGIPEVEEAIALLDALSAAGLRAERVQARHRRADPPRAGDRRRGAAAHDRGARRGRPRRRPSLLGGARRAAARDLPRVSPAPERPAVRRWRGGRPGARGGALVRRVVRALRRACDADRRRARRHGRDGVPGGERVAGVKRALVAASGSEEWVARGARAGGVTSARSNLDADIHLLDNAAARAAHLLEEVAGDAVAVAARREEIVAALARTAKPYFGDVEAMSYGELLERFTARLRDGARRALRRRRVGPSDVALARPVVVPALCCAAGRADAGPIDVPVGAAADLDDPAGALAAFRRAFAGRGHDAAASRRRAVLPRGLRSPRQARAVRPGARRRGPPLVHGRRVVAGAGRAP